MNVQSSKYILVAVVPTLIVVFYLLTAANSMPPTNSIPSANSMEEKFTILSNSQTNYCAAPDFLTSKEDVDRLQGSCCSKMDFHRYAEQVEGLKQYSSIDVIPSDPYDIEASLAKRLVAYAQTIQLDAQQQEVYDNAMKISAEGGPCCCKCWRWTAFEGQAKYLIVNYNFNEKQIAQVWDLEDGCGGSGHADHTPESS